MAVNESDPAADPGAEYDYVGGDVDRPALVEALEARVNGEVRFDEYSRELYATDASAYRAVPVGVVFPKHTADVAAVVSYCADHEIPVLPRGGGTSLAGQAVNEAVVLDLSKHMTGVEDIDPEGREAVAQAGVKLARLNERLRPHGLKFAPDPAAGDRSVLGGAIGNNSTGAHSLKYGKTDAYIEEVEAVLADGTVTTFGETEIETLRENADADGDIEERVYAEVLRIIDEESDEVEEKYPNLKRNVSGYNLDVLVREARGDGATEEGTVNLARLLAGSEGTLATVTKARVGLEPIPATKSMALLTYSDLVTAMEDVAPILEHDPAAVELVDDTLLDLAGETEEFGELVEMLPGDAGAVLLVEFYAESDEDGVAKVAGLLRDRCPSVTPTGDAGDDPVTADAPVFADEALEAYDEAERTRFWKLRKSGLPILLGRTSDEKHISFIEDTAIPPEHLPEYVAAFQDVLADHGTSASFYAHAGPGVLHIRPLVNLKSETGIEQFEGIADDVTDLVVKYGGSVSGEHGDGRARTQWNRKLYGDELWQAFRDLKTAFDPDWLLNPGNVCGDAKMTENLRYGTEYEFDPGFEPELQWRNENGFEGMVELCHGCAGCRGDQDTTGGVMCPTYRASGEEIQSTRGRANLLRDAMSGELDGDADDEFLREVMDLCVGCKGCSRDCPSEVDMAKMKVELEHDHHEREGASLRDKLFANIDALAGVASRVAPLSNLANYVPGAGRVAEATVGIAAERDLPEFRRETFHDWFAARGGARVSERDAERSVVFLADTFTNYIHPENGKAAVKVLEAAGVHVELADVTDTGRPAHSKGFLDKARNTAADVVRDLHPHVRDGRDVVLVEPSDAVMVQSDYRDLLDTDAMHAVADRTYGVMEYLDTFRLDDGLDAVGEGSMAYHGHCHQKATKKDHHAVGVLRRAGYDVDALDSTCCGMSGSFGYEAEHYSMSRAIGNMLFDQVAESSTEEVVAPGTSCRTQLEDLVDDVDTPVQKLAAALD
ncbi:FAD-binding and (Fe-S)-binding domain-containing protein [Halocalculus aciditolerans]|uniref:D-lactate dehydrogenase (cytochrome) n=1 Tax=Halocalculus aciditolerans TaxID=1383812 RepID=A0A830FQD6_9EURY|nr:FAD-binding and (Fe-S)-binding domain-containing protein [Halocalculus aciditolerans]GGL70282.1 FAD-dependent oxidoreductase [Halocalculus aciditolerans]